MVHTGTDITMARRWPRSTCSADWFSDTAALPLCSKTSSRDLTHLLHPHRIRRAGASCAHTTTNTTGASAAAAARVPPPQEPTTLASLAPSAVTAKGSRVQGRRGFPGREKSLLRAPLCCEGSRVGWGWSGVKAPAWPATAPSAVTAEGKVGAHFLLAGTTEACVGHVCPWVVASAAPAGPSTKLRDR